jgi:hypothetical protein
MEAVTALPRSRPLTRAELDSMPDDGHRYELIDGVLPAAPVLAIEILSPSTRLFDLNTTKARFEVAGCASYWVVDPDDASLTAWELVDGRYVEVAHVVGTDAFTATRPYAVEIVPDALVR